MTDYEMEPDKLFNSKWETTKKILYVMEDEKKTIREIYREGKQEFGNDFPNDINTVRRYINTLEKIGYIERDGWQRQYTGPSSYSPQEVVPDIDKKIIETWKNKLNNPKTGLEKTLLEPILHISSINMAIYGIPNPANISSDVKESLNRIETWLSIYYQELSYWVTEALDSIIHKHMEEEVLIHADRNIDEYIALVAHQFGLFSFESIGEKQMRLKIENPLKVAEIIQEHYDADISKKEIVNYKMDTTMAFHLWKHKKLRKKRKLWGKIFPTIIMTQDRNKQSLNLFRIDKIKEIRGKEKG